jgi:2',3'-cyclic-nucleotide 2'-phosphodiesterase (5'-nucleotidase family)
MKNIVNLLALLLILGVGCTPSKTFLADQKVSTYRLKNADSLKVDPSVEATIKPYRTKMAAQMDEVIGRTAQELFHAQPEGLLGNWAVDLFHRQAEMYYGRKIDFSALNQSGLRLRSLPQGDITRRHIFELMPFDNTITILQGDAAMIEKLFQHIALKGGWPISHASFEMHPHPEGPKISHLHINGAHLENNRLYTFALPDYIANGDDGCEFLKTAKRENLAKLVRDAFIEGCQRETKEGRLLDAKPDGRIMIVND